MKKLGAILLALVLAVALAIPMTTPVVAHTESDPQVQTLYAGQDIDVGTDCVWNDGTNLYVTYEINEPPWIITETHLYVGQNEPPTTAPGQFPYSDEDAASITDTMVTYEIPLTEIDAYSMQLNKKGKPTGVMVADGSPPADCWDTIHIAAHAVVEKVDTFNECLVSGAGSDDVLYLEEDELNPGYPEGYTADYQTYSGTVTPSVLAWTHSAWAPYGVTGAEWISSSYYTENTDYNTWRLFTRGFDLPTDATNISGTLTMNSDNAEDVYLNGTNIGDGSPAIVYGPSVKDVFPPSGVQHGWNTVEGPWDVSSELIAGTNELWTMTRNYAWSGGPTANPTGLIYKLCYSYDIVTTETAWGDGSDLPTANWAMSFEYEIQCQPEILVVTQVLAGDNDASEKATVESYLSDLGYTEVTSIWEPSGRLTSGDLAGYDVVIYLAWSYPAGYTNVSTAQTLMDYFDGGGRLIIIGDDISRVGPQSSPGHPYQPQNTTYGDAWEAMTRLDYANNGGSTELGITDGYQITLGSGPHDVLTGIEGGTFTYYIDADTTSFLDVAGATSLATAARNSTTPYSDLTGGPAIVAYDGAGKIVVIGLAFYNGYYVPSPPNTVPAIPVGIAKTLLDNSINWLFP